MFSNHETIAITNIVIFYQTDRSFVTGVIKVQTGRESLLNHDEKRSLCRAGGLLPEDTPNDEEELAVPTASLGLTYKEALKRKREERSRGAKSRYHLAVKKAIPCSAAEVERIWSRACHVLTRERSTMAPIMFEAIMFLKYNKRLWGLVDIGQLA